jgi:mono/diheme cytochrome c family protein
MAVVLAGCGNGDASTTTVTASQTAAVGDPVRGRQIWEDGGGVVAVGCSQCHSLDGSESTFVNNIAPTWQGILGLAGDRVPGLSAEEYLRESIVDPDAYIVEGYSANLMPKGFKFLLSEEDIDGLVAFLLTQ